MIIEGKHSELGQGIFVSDIQEGSNAEKVRDSLNYKLDTRDTYTIVLATLFTVLRSEHEDSTAK